MNEVAASRQAAEQRFDKEQEQAIESCVTGEARIVAVTGQAGTGKTSIIRAVAERFEALGIDFAIAAPTGKAARRIKEATGYDAHTIHKLLEFPRPDEIDEATGKALLPTVPRRDKSRPLTQKVLIVDEYAMVSWELHHALINALPHGGHLRVFGDDAQLAPIEPAETKFKRNESPFQFLLRAHDKHTLTKVYRQAGDSDVLIAATRIREGAMPTKLVQVKVDVTSDPLASLRRFLDSSPIDFSSLKNQIISPARKGPFGTHALNIILQNRYLPSPLTRIMLPRHKWATQYEIAISEGDKVVCTENTYDLRDWTERYAEWQNGRPNVASLIPAPENKQMLNGEIGIVKKVHYDGAMEVDFGDRLVEIPPAVEEFYAKRGRTIPVDYRRNIDLAYALTTHKCQGSEFGHIVYVMNSAIWYNLSRRNFYTAVTRARESATICADQRSLLRSLQNKE